jgi:hypothetical protein
MALALGGGALLGGAAAASGGKGGSSTPQPQQVNTQTSNLPEYARPYFENLVQRAQAQSYQPYTPYGGQRIAGFTPAQEQIQQNVLGLGAPNQFGAGSSLAYQAGLGALGQQNYNPQQFNAQQVGAPNLQQYQMGPAFEVSSQQVGTPQMGAARTSFGQQPLEQFRMAGPQMFGSEQAQQYMSPYLRNVLDTQKREAVRDARQGQVVQDLGAARQGTYGGSRQLLAGLERERNLGQQLGDIEARGMQSAFENAQGQFERDRAAGMTTGQQNLQAALQQQQLGTQTGLQAALANLSSEQQANVQNQAAQLQTQGLNSEQAMRAALANQQAGLTVGQQNLQALLGTQQLGAQQGLQAALANQQTGLEAQRFGEQSRQFGAQQGLAGLQAAGQMGQTLGNLGQYQQQADLQRLQAQSAAAGEQRGLQQQYLDQDYADFLRQRDYDMERLGQYSNILRGLPVGLSTTNTTYATPPSFASQALGTGLAGLSMSRMLGG